MSPGAAGEPSWGGPRVLTVMSHQSGGEMAETNEDRGAASRRTLLAGVGMVGVAGSLAACGTASSTDSGGTTGGGSSPTAGSNGGGGLAKTTDIPEGGGKIIGDVVITQPAAGQFKAF